jgi:hypothetical protein
MDSSGDDPTVAALAWLLSSDEPAVRYLTRRELLDDRDGAAAAAEAAQLLQEPEQDVGAPLVADPQPPVAHQPGHTPLRRIAVAAQPLARVNAAPGEVAGPSCVLSDALPYLGFAVL